MNAVDQAGAICEPDAGFCTVSGHNHQPTAEPMSRIEHACWLRGALIGMTIRYGSSKQLVSYADRRARDGEPGAEEKLRRHMRACRRRFAAIQRLATALANLAVTR